MTFPFALRQSVERLYGNHRQSRGRHTQTRLLSFRHFPSFFLLWIWSHVQAFPVTQPSVPPTNRDKRISLEGIMAAS